MRFLRLVRSISPYSVVSRRAQLRLVRELIRSGGQARRA